MGLLGMMLLDCEEREKSNCLRGFSFFLQAAMPFSSSVQQPLSSCASSNSLLEFKGGSSSTTTTTTTTWRTGSWTRSSLLLLRVCVHPAIPLYPSNFFAVHLTSSQSAPGIEIEAALRDLCNCKPSCVVPLSLSLSLSL